MSYLQKKTWVDFGGCVIKCLGMRVKKKSQKLVFPWYLNYSLIKCEWISFKCTTRCRTTKSRLKLIWVLWHRLFFYLVAKKGPDTSIFFYLTITWLSEGIYLLKLYFKVPYHQRKTGIDFWGCYINCSWIRVKKG